ncbi:hypothetical protein K3495_g11228 [Podosphaera aphanis]|nr:hypothetical protein K3495_g11228 [Podosphaera aphanis]
MRIRTSKMHAKHKTEALALVYIDVAGPFPKSLRENKYFLQIIDNYTRKNWSIPLKSKDESAEMLKIWRTKVELQSGKKVKAVRSDNAPELKKLINQWERLDGIQVEYTVIASSNQNGAAERSIQTAENSMRAMLEDSKLPVEFWDEAVEADAYLRNRTPTGPIVNGDCTCPEWAFTGVKPSVNHIRVWGSKAYAYVDPKTLPKESRHDKLILRGREGVFMGYTDPTDKQLKIYAPDLGYTVRTSVLFVDENIKGGTLDLRLRNNHSGAQGTPNQLPDRKTRGRPRKGEISPQNPTTVPSAIDEITRRPNENHSRLVTTVNPNQSHQNNQNQIQGNLSELQIVNSETPTHISIPKTSVNETYPTITSTLDHHAPLQTEILTHANPNHPYGSSENLFPRDPEDIDMIDEFGKSSAESEGSCCN